jgi:hypothetical protein
MTLPDERYRAVMWAKKLLEDIANPKITPRIPQIIRQRAYSALRHYPSEWELQEAARHAPNIFAERMEELYRMVKQHELDKQEKEINNESK